MILFESFDWQKPGEDIHVGPNIIASWQLY
jgi:hypothetical protein